MFKKISKEMTVWKKCRRTAKDEFWYVLVKLLIPVNTTVRFPDKIEKYQKHRSSRAVVKGIYTLKGRKSKFKKCFSEATEPQLTYVVGKTVKPKGGLSRNDRACESGIHFFLDRDRAVKYDFS